MTPMNAQTLEALKASIAKWERNAEAKTSDEYLIGDIDCPLCNLFVHPGNCKGCPVFEKTGERFCRDTPYRTATFAWYDWGDGIEAAADRAHAAARDEVAFLKSLLPEETQATWGDSGPIPGHHCGDEFDAEPQP